jgi:hypothetical protein
VQKKTTEKRDKEQLVLPGFVLTNSLEKLANELFGMDYLDFREIDITKHIEMMVAGDDVVGICRDGAINKLVVVGVGGDERKTKMRIDGDNE